MPGTSSGSLKMRNEAPKYWNVAIESMPRGELERLQLDLLKAELAFAYANSAYYKRVFDEACLHPA